MLYKNIASVLIGAAAAVALDGKYASSDTFAALVATIDTNEEGRGGEALQGLAKRIDEYENQVTTALAAADTYGEGSGVEPLRELAKRTDENKDGAKNGVRGAGSVIADDLQFMRQLKVLPFDLPAVPDSNTGDTSYDVSSTDVGDFGIGDFHIEMDVTGKGFDISKREDNYGALFIRSADFGLPYSGPSVFIHDNGNVLYRLSQSEGLTCEGALPDPTDKVTRHLVFSRTGNTLFAVINGTNYGKTITKDISNVETFRKAPLRFRGNHENSIYQSLYMDVSKVNIYQREISNSPSRSPSKQPSTSPTTSPSKHPSTSPSMLPSASPSLSPSKSPNKAPTAAPISMPWTLERKEVIVDFSAAAAKSVQFKFEKGRGREAKHYLTAGGCGENKTVGADLVTTTENLTEAADVTLDLLTIRHIFNMSRLATSKLFDNGTNTVQFCQDIGLYHVESGENYLITQLLTNVSIILNLTSGFSTAVVLDEGTVGAANETVKLQDFVTAFHCDGAVDKPLVDAKLKPNEVLSVCVVSTSADVEIESLETMNADNLGIIVGGEPAIRAITTLAAPNAMSRIVSTRLPLNLIAFTNGASVKIAGSLTLRLKGGRRHLAGGDGLAGRRLQAVDAGEEVASFALSVALAPEEEVRIQVAAAATATAAGMVLGAVAAVLFLAW